METLAIIKHFNVFKDGLLRLVAGLEATMMQQLTLERGEKALYRGVVVRIARSAHARVMAAVNNFVVGLGASLGYANLASASRDYDAEIAAQLLT